MQHVFCHADESEARDSITTVDRCKVYNSGEKGLGMIMDLKNGMKCVHVTFKHQRVIC